MPTNVNLLTKLSGLAAAALLAGACEATKSETPTSPNVAGPIAGIGISKPEVKSPIDGNAVVNTDPLRLTWTQSTTTGQRPLWYSVELASDRDFAQRVYFNPKVLPIEGPQMSLVVDVRIEAERTYFWRVRAEDGANVSEYSGTAFFNLVIPVVLGAPTAISPSGGATIGTRSPQLHVNNGGVQGRAGDVAYVFTVATDQAFTNVAWSGYAARSAGSTTSLTTAELAASTMFYWRAQASNGTANSAPSNILGFRTPAAAPAPGPAGGGGGGGGLPPAPGGSFRTPDPAPGQRLPLPAYGASVVQSIASQYGNALRNSCQDTGGTWEFLDRVVDALRQCDTRWGYNGKRGNANDPSKDVVDYHYGRGQSENSTDVYIIDVIVGHCGSNPSAGWGDVTNVTVNSGTIGRWIGRGRFTN